MVFHLGVFTVKIISFLAYQEGHREKEWEKDTTGKKSELVGATIIFSWLDR